MSYMYIPAPQAGTACSGQDLVGPYTRHIRSLVHTTNHTEDSPSGTTGPRSSLPPWGDRWGAAGLIVVAIAAQGCFLVCSVDNDKTIGFPKGRAERGDTSALGTALREWTEETGLLTTHLQVEVEPLVHSGPW